MWLTSSSAGSGASASSPPGPGGRLETQCCPKACLWVRTLVGHGEVPRDACRGGVFPLGSPQSGPLSPGPSVCPSRELACVASCKHIGSAKERGQAVARGTGATPSGVRLGLRPLKAGIQGERELRTLESLPPTHANCPTQGCSLQAGGPHQGRSCWGGAVRGRGLGAQIPCWAQTWAEVPPPCAPQDEPRVGWSAGAGEAPKELLLWETEAVAQGGDRGMAGHFVATGSRDMVPFCPIPAAQTSVGRGTPPPCGAPSLSCRTWGLIPTCLRSSRLRLGEWAAARGGRAWRVSLPLAGVDAAIGTWRVAQESTGGESSEAAGSGAGGVRTMQPPPG